MKISCARAPDARTRSRFRRPMAFEDDYILLGNKTQVISGLETLLLLRPPPGSWRISTTRLLSVVPVPHLSLTAGLAMKFRLRVQTDGYVCLFDTVDDAFERCVCFRLNNGSDPLRIGAAFAHGPTHERLSPDYQHA